MTLLKICASATLLFGCAALGASEGSLAASERSLLSGEYIVLHDVTAKEALAALKTLQESNIEGHIVQARDPDAAPLRYHVTVSSKNGPESIRILETKKAQDDAFSRSIITPSARGCPKRLHGPAFTAEFLYWKIEEDERAYAIKQIGTSGNLRFFEPNFTWTPGVRLGLGYNLPCDGWDLSSNWTYFHKQISSSVSSTEEVILAFRLFNLPNSGGSFPQCTSAKSHWKFLFNAAGLELGRNFFISPKLSFRPHSGLKAAWIRQSDKSHYGGVLVPGNPPPPFPSTLLEKNRSWGVGPQVGCQARWMYVKDFAVFTDAAAALLYGRFHLSSVLSEFVPASSARVGFVEDIYRLRPNFQLVIGLDWGTCCAKNRYIYFSAAYEAQIWWSQWIAPTPNNLFADGDLMMQGLTLKSKFDF